MSAFSNLLSGQSSREIGRLLKTVVQKQINEQLTDTDISDSETHTPVKLSNTKDLSLVGDLAAQASFNVATEIANNHYMTFEPDGVDLRLWLKFQNAGTLVDYAKQGIKAYSVGENNLPGTFIHYNDDINVKYEIFSYFNGQSHFAFAKDDPAIQLKNIIVDNNKSFALHMRMKPITFTQSSDDANITVASKVDDDQLRYGYSITVTPQGHMHFYIRKDYVQYHLFIKDAYSWLFEDPNFISGHSFNKSNFSSVNFQTTYAYLCKLANSPDMRFEDWIFNYKPTNNQMSVILNGDTVMADSLTTPSQKPYMNLALQDGKWTHTSSTIINNIVRDSSGNAKNGTVSGGFTWNIDNGLYNYGSDELGTTGGMEVTFPNDATTNTMTQFTATLWYYLWDTSINTRTYDAIIMSKGINVNNSFWVEHIAGSNKIRANIRTGSGDVVSVESSRPLRTNTFNFIMIRWKSGEKLKLIVDGAVEDNSNDEITTTLVNGSTQLKLGSISKSIRSQIALFKFYTIQISEQTINDLIYAGWNNPLFPTSESIQPEPEPDPTPISVPYSVKAEYPPVVPSAAIDFRYINTAGGDNPYFPVYECPLGVSVVDPIVPRYDVGPGAVIPGTPQTGSVEVPSNDNSFNVLQRTTTTNEIAGLQIRAPVNRPNPTNSGLFNQILNKVSTAPTFPAPAVKGMIKKSGPVFTDASIYYIFAGNDWNTRTTPYSKQQVTNAIQTIHSSTYFDHLIQYGVKKPKIGGIVHNTTWNNFSNPWTVNNVGSIVIDSIEKGLVPQKTASNQNIYVVLMPHNIPYVNGEGGFNTVIYFTQNSPLLERLPIAGVAGSSLDLKTLIITNEVVEPVTNPYGATDNTGQHDGWVADPNVLDVSNQNRIADVCEHMNNQTLRVNGIRVSPYYSNHHGGCINPDSTVNYAICPTGSTYSSTTQMCETSTGGGGTTTGTAPTIPPFPQPQGVVYKGGVVYSAPAVHVIFDGAVWNTATNPSKQQIIDKCNIIMNSTYFDALLQYNIKKPRSINYVTKTTNNLPNTYTPQDVRNFIINAVSTGLVPSNQPVTQKNIYLIVAGPNKTYSNSNAYGFHDYSRVNNDNNTLLIYAIANWESNPIDIIPRTLFSELLECMTDPIWNISDEMGWRIDRNIVSGGIGNEICDPGEPYNNIFIDGANVRPYWSNIDQKVVPPPTAPTWLTCPTGSTYDKVTQTCIGGGAPGPGGGGGGTGNAALDKDGVFSLYGTGEINYNPTQDYKSESKRLDWNINSSSRFVSLELTVYVRMSNPPQDECSCSLGGGGHSSGSRPECYVVGVGTRNGAVRLRLEEYHPDYEEIGQGTAVGAGLAGNRWIGYKYIKWNKPNGVQIEVWQDVGNNDSAPSNQWVKLGSWLETRENWRTPPSDHKAIFRIDGTNSQLDTFEYKWPSIREIKTTDTGNAPVDPGTPEPLPEPPLVGIGADLLDKTIKKASFWMQGGSSPTGTGYCRIWDENNQPVATLGSFSASGLSTSNYVRRDFTNNNNTVKMKRGYTIGIEYKSGSTSDYIKLQRRSVNYDSSIVQASKKYQGPWGINEAFEIKCVLVYSYLTPDIEEWHVMGSTPLDVGMLGEVFNTGSPMIGIPPTHVEYRMYRYINTLTGTINLDHISATGELKGRLKTISAVTLPTSEPTENNFVWENFNYLGKIVAGDRLAITVEGVGSDAIYVMTNSGSAATNEYDGIRSHLIYKDNTTGWISDNKLDITGKIASGGNNFEAYERFTATKTYIGEKIVNRNSLLYGRRITRKTIKAKRIGSPTGIITCGIMDVNYNIKAILGTRNVTTIGTTGYDDIQFSNPGVSYRTAEGDRMFLLYEGATEGNTIEINMGRDFVDELNSIAYYIDGNNTVDLGNKDIAGTIFIGGELDVNSRSRITQSIEHQNSEFKGLPFTKILVYMYRTTTNTTGTAYCNIRRGTDDEIMTELGSVNIANLSTNPANPTPVIFTTQSSSYLSDVGDKISIEFEGGNTTDKVGVMVKNIAVTQTTAIYSFVRKYNGVNYADSETQFVIAGYYSVGGYTYTPDPNAVPDATPVADKDLIFCAGRNKISGFFESIVAEARIYSKEITLEMAGNLYLNKYTILPRGSNEVLIPFTFKPSGMT